MYGMYGLYSMFSPSMIVLIPAILFTLYAQAKVKSAYNKYIQIPNRRGMTGAQAARMILDSNGLRHVPIQIVQGTLSDYYDPKNDVMNLSNDVYYGTSIASVSIAAHESGHAIQDGTSYAFLRFRSSMAPVVNFASTASWPLLIIGLVIIGAGNVTTGNLVFDIGIIFFLAVVLFHLVTLPVELNASSRAIKQMMQLYIVDAEEKRGAKKVLSAAAMTYIAALATAVANLVRFLVIRGRN